MSDDDDGRVVLPFMSRAAGDDAQGDDDGPAETAPAPAGAPAVPGGDPGELAPPLHLVMPGVPELEDTSEGAFVGPDPEDPDAAPSGKDALGTAMALMTAMGVAGAQGMWHRSRQRKAHADHARAQADKAKAAAQAAKKTGGTTTGKTTKSASGGLGGGRRSSSGGGGSKGGGGSRGGSGGPKGTGRSTGGGKGLTGGGKGLTGGGRSGRSGGGTGGSKGGLTGRRNSGGGNGRTGGGGSGKGSSAARRGGGALAPTGRNSGGTKGPNGGRGDAAGAKGGARGASWFFRGGRSGDGTTKNQAKPTDPTGKPSGKPTGGPDGGPDGTARAWRTTARWKAGHGHWVGFTGRPSDADWKVPPHTDETFWFPPPGQSRGWTPPPGEDRWTPPGPDGMRPPPAAAPYRTWAEQVIPDPAAVTSAERLALDAGTAPAPTEDPTKGETVTVSNTQYADDSELTIHDVIEADTDMAEQITAGVAEAQSAADGCDALYRRLEALHAQVVELRVPGSLEGMLVQLMEQTANVRSSAATIAERLPAAAESIATAGSNAESRHRPLADAVRDAGHARPAERDYHNE